MRRKTAIIRLPKRLKRAIIILFLSGKTGSDGKGAKENERMRRKAPISLCPPQGRGRFFMEEKRVAILSVIVEDRESAGALNALLSEYGGYIIGRMGIPYREKGISILSVVLDAPAGAINALTGKIGQLAGVTAKTLFSKY